MGVEIERKFLVADPAILDGLEGTSILQGYLLDDPASTIRIRRAGDRAFLTIKGPVVGISRPEFETEIPLDDATEMLGTMRRGQLVAKTRYELPDGPVTWEIDVFEADNAGLIVAEVELADEAQVVARPPWLGPEVTDDPRYLNVNLARHPYREWGIEAEPEALPAPPLQIDGLGDISLADLLREAGCPLCRLRRDAADRYLRALLWEGVNDIGFRQRLAAGRGFCRRHAGAVLTADRGQSGGSVGATILLASMARRRLAELKNLPVKSARRARGAIRSAGEPAACPVCAQIAEAERMAMERLVTRLTDTGWRQAVETAELCLDDLLRLWAVAVEAGQLEWAPVAATQLARVEHLVERLDSYAHHSSHDRRHLMTDAERSAADEAAAFLGGS